MKSSFPRLAAIWVLGMAASGPVQAELHEFTSTDGRKIKAELIHYEQGKATLKLESGQQALVPLASLSEPDREYVDLWNTDPNRVNPINQAEMTMAQYLGGRGYTGIPYRDDKQAIVVDLTFGGAAHPFMINTALPYSFIDSAVANSMKMELRLTPEMLGTLDGRQVTVSEGPLANFKIGESTVPSRKFRVTDLTNTGLSNAGLPVEGVLGFDFLKEFGVVIDYKAKVFYFLPPAG